MAELADAVRRLGRAVLQAPPGSGKTTLVAPFLLDAGLVPPGKQIVLLQPRRVAARSVARRLASLRGERVGETVGYRVRFDSKVSARTRICVVTEGILTRWLQRDPELNGVGAVIFDEFHERSLNADLGLALVKEVSDALREDLKIVVMSATLDAQPIADYLAPCRVIRSEGRAYPLEIQHRAGPPIAGLRPEGLAAAVEGALGALDLATEGDVLVFLPGVREIDACRSRLLGSDAASGRDVLTLHGRLPPSQQDAVLRPGDRPRIVLATNLAETSLTIPKITAVIDSGLAKVMRYEPKLGSGRLYTERISQASADQRAGRAGRLGPGRAIRLWRESEAASMALFEDPEIIRTDLAPMVLDLASWGVVDPGGFDYFQAPPADRLAGGVASLRRLQAIGAHGAITALGRRAVSVPAHPRVGIWLAAAAQQGVLDRACWWAAALDTPARGSAPPVPGVSADVTAWLIAWHRQGGGVYDRVRRVASQLARAAGGKAAKAPPTARDEHALLPSVLHGFGDFLGERRAPGSDRVRLASGRGARLSRESLTAASGARFVVALSIDGGRRAARAESLVRLAAEVPLAMVEASHHCVEGVVLGWENDRVIARRQRSFLGLVLQSQTVQIGDPVAASLVLEARARKEPLVAFGTSSRAEAQLCARLVTFARAYPELELPVDARGWLEMALPVVCAGRRSYKDLRDSRPFKAARDLMDYAVVRKFNDVMPERIKVPSGSRVAIVYDTVEAPVLAAKVQELFGLIESPKIAQGRVHVVMHLLNPAGRPLQVTRDLHSFWTTTWSSVRAEMRSRYPKHSWPEDPLIATASRRSIKRKR